MINKKFLLFASCLLVKGKKQSIICDLQRNFIYPIPDALSKIISKYEGCTLDFIKAEFNNNFDDIIDEYFKVLEEKEMVFFTNDTELFPSLSMEWDEPFNITNAIIDITTNHKNSIIFIQQLSEIGCHSVQIRIFNLISIEKVEMILSSIGKGRISSVEVLLHYDDSFTIEKLTNLCEKFHRISIITFYNSPKKEIYHARPNKFGTIFFITEKIESEKCCGQITLSTFTINIKTFTESKHQNSCLNRKISIDTEGNIKNCPSMKKSYGNIKDTTLQEALDHPDFKKLWNINKDKIHVCKDCEFRYICTDCRAYIENPEDIYSKPLKCGYNPYTGEWSEWSTNPLKQKAIEHYGMQDLVAADDEKA